jgi:hypothetical protein
MRMAKPEPITEDLANKLLDYAIACDWGQSGQWVFLEVFLDYQEKPGNAARRESQPGAGRGGKLVGLCKVQFRLEAEPGNESYALATRIEIPFQKAYSLSQWLD